MLITAVLTTYQRLDLAKRAINSILEQSYKKTEILIIEDGSATGLEDWINHNRFNNIKYHNNQMNKGLAASRNWGINNANGRYIGFLDDDDEWKPNMLEEAYINLSSLDTEQKLRVGSISFGIELIKNNKITPKM